MARNRQRSSGIFSGIVLVAVGVVLLLHNYRGLDLGDALLRWWPLILIFLGAIKLYDRVAIGRSGEARSARITGGEILLVIGMLTLLSCVVAYDYTKGVIKDRMPFEMGDAYPFDLDVSPMTVPPNARVTIRGGHGDITVRAGDASEIRVNGKKNVHGWSEDDAQHRSAAVSVQIVQNGDGYEVHPTGSGSSDSGISIDMVVQVPKKSQVFVRNDRGDITVSDMAAPVSLTNTNGDVEVHNTNSDVTIEMHRGDVKVSDTTGDVKISGRGGEVDVASTTGSFTLDGEFYGPIRADKIAKGVRFLSQRTDLTLTKLTGHLETSSGNMEIVDAPGDLALRTNRYSVTIENASGKVKVDNRDGDVDLRFSNPPKDDIDVNNANASISLTLPSASSFGINANCHSCDVDSEFSADTLKKTSTDSGNSSLTGKYGSARGPQITLTTSYGAVSIHKTS